MTAVVVTLALNHGSSRKGPAHAGAVGVGGIEKIDISNFAFSPAAVTVKVGSTIAFTNEDSVEHTATSDSEGLFNTGTLNKGQTVHIKLNKAGTISYHCSFHAFMHGTINVVQ